MSRAPAAAFALAAALAAPGCIEDKVGTIALGLTTAPGATLLDNVTRLRLTFTNPRQVLLVDRTESGFDLSLDLEATGEVGSLVVDGLDATGALIATGMSPPFPLAAIDARIVVYMAPPMSVGRTPAALAPARSKSSAAALGYGAILAGGVDEAGGPSAAVQIYNAYDHSLVTGLPLPEGRSGITIAVDSNNRAYLFGGTGPGGTPTGTLWYFDTTIAPAGRYAELGDSPQFARTGRAAVPVSINNYLITGAPPIQLAGSLLTEPAGIPAISSGASVTGSDRALATIAIDEASGDLIRIRGSVEPLGAQRKNGVVVALPGGRVAVLGADPAPRDATIVDAATGALTPVPGALTDVHTALVAASTPRFLVVAGNRGTDGAMTAVEILDAQTLERRAYELVEGPISAAIALPNEQVLLVAATLRLFTPPPPPSTE